MLIHEFTPEGYHRLIEESSGETSPWATYTQICLLKDMVGVTAYYASKEGIMTPAEFCELIAAK